MELTSLDIEVLQRLSQEPWISPPLFDHSLFGRLVSGGYVETETLASGAVRYVISEEGLGGIIES
jgi:hypothetical protein